MNSPTNDQPGGRSGHVKGSRCVACGATAYPAAAGCVRCGGAEVAVVELSDRGTIASRTKVDDRWICEIRLAEGPLVLGWLDGREAACIGMRARLAPGCEASPSLRFTHDD